MENLDNSKIQNKKKFSIKFVIILLAIIIAIAGIIGTILFYNKYQETDILVQDIGKLMVLPTGEDPTVATVTDATKLTSRNFFKDVQNGDKLLAYTIAKKAILYRPSTNKIINIAPFNIDPSTTEINNETIKSN